ncbi:chromo domain-containing protein 1 [Geosmithia morbida]|uniref:Chromo domain-containing protein 1 n=1 Tax=Geosmithia morbida TaxID=1094350 RepID=A0A9P5D1Y4_9HYPO|nr:chromo domain-containing protein 1 [Geosmithia morbida]KAF4120946.1 chromo domain-containing protein 1 [Geosmithia morbida]
MGTGIGSASISRVSFTLSTRSTSVLPVQETTSDDDLISLSSTIDETHDSDEEWMAEGILAEGVMDGEMKYLVEWTGFPLDDATWEPASHLNDILLGEWAAQKEKVKRGEAPRFKIRTWRDAAVKNLCDRHARHEKRNARRVKDGLVPTSWNPSLERLIELVDIATPKDPDDADSDEDSIDFDRLDHSGPVPRKVTPHEQGAALFDNIKQRSQSPADRHAAITSKASPSGRNASASKPKNGAPTSKPAANKLSRLLSRPPITDRPQVPLLPKKRQIVKSAIKSSKKSTKPVSNIFISGKQRKVHTHTAPNQSLFGHSAGIRNGENRAPTQIPRSLIHLDGRPTAPLQIIGPAADKDKTPAHKSPSAPQGSTSSQQPGVPQESSTPQSQLPTEYQDMMIIDIPATSAPELRGQTAPPRPPSALKKGTQESRRKSVGWVDSDQLVPDNNVAYNSPEESMFVPDEAPQSESSMQDISTDAAEIPKPPTPPRGYKKPSQASIPIDIAQQQTVPVLCFVGENLAFRHTCTAVDFGTQFRRSPQLVLNLARGSITALSEPAALESLAQWLRPAARAVMFHTDNYCILAFPADSSEWELEAADVPKTDGPLKFTIFERTFSDTDLPKTDEKGPRGLQDWELSLPKELARMSALDSSQVLPHNDRRLLGRRQVFLAFPPGAIEESRLIAQWFITVSNLECDIYDSLSPGAWSQFLKRGCGTVVIHEDALWKTRQFPGMLSVLDQVAAGNYAISVFKKGYGDNEVLAEWPGTSRLTGDIGLLPVFSGGKAFLMTPSFVITQPHQASLFLGYFNRSLAITKAAFRAILIVPADFEDWLADLIVERSRRPTDKNLEHHKKDIESLEKMMNYMDQLVALTHEGDLSSPLVYAPAMIDASDEQSLVNWFGWWSIMNMNQIGMRESDDEEVMRAVEAKELLSLGTTEAATTTTTTASAPTLVSGLSLTDRTAEKRLGGATRLKIVPNDEVRTLREHLKNIQKTARSLQPMLWVYFIPVTHWDSRKDRLALGKRPTGASFSQWFRYMSPFDSQGGNHGINTSATLFYTSEGGGGIASSDINAASRPWLVFFRPVEPHRKTWKETELLIFDPAYRGRVGARDVVHEGDLVDVQQRLLASVNEFNANKNPTMPLTKVWLAGWRNSIESPHAEALDITLDFLDLCIRDPKMWLPAPKEAMESRGWKIVIPTSAGKNRPESMDVDEPDGAKGSKIDSFKIDGISKKMAERGSAGEEAKVAIEKRANEMLTEGLDDTDDDPGADYLSRKKVLFLPPRGRLNKGNKGESVCVNEIFRQSRLAESRGEKTMTFVYSATRFWYAHQVEEGRDFKHMMVDGWDKVFSHLRIP